MDIASVKATSATTMWTSALANDQGACCQSRANFVALIGANGVAASVTGAIWTPDATTSLSGVSGSGLSCPAFFVPTLSGGGAGAAALFSATAFEGGTVAYSSWWCSNGLYKNVLTAAASATGTTVNTTLNKV